MEGALLKQFPRQFYWKRMVHVSLHSTTFKTTTTLFNTLAEYLFCIIYRCFQVIFRQELKLTTTWLEFVLPRELQLSGISIPLVLRKDGFSTNSDHVVMKLKAELLWHSNDCWKIRFERFHSSNRLDKGVVPKQVNSSFIEEHDTISDSTFC